MESFKEKIDYCLKREKRVIQNFYNQKDFEDWHLASLSKLYSDLAFYQIVERQFAEGKNDLSIVGLVDIYLVSNYSKSHSSFLDFDLPRCLASVLSDNESLIQRYAKLRYQRGSNAKLSMDEMVAQGESPIWCNTVQFFMANDKTGVERNLNILETITLKKLPKREELLVIDYNFYKALFERDKSKVEETLAILVSPKIHKKRNDNPVLNQYISLPALGYAKLAWRYGIEAVIDTPLIPRQLLPIQPLAKYEIPYDFLK